MNCGHCSTYRPSLIHVVFGLIRSKVMVSEDAVRKQISP